MVKTRTCRKCFPYLTDIYPGMKELDILFTQACQGSKCQIKRKIDKMDDYKGIVVVNNQSSILTCMKEKGQF